MLRLVNSQDLGKKSSVLSQDYFIDQLSLKEEVYEMWYAEWSESYTLIGSRERIGRGKGLNQKQLGVQSQNSFISLCPLQGHIHVLASSESRDA